MPKNSKTRGMRQPEQVLNSLGKWVNNKFAGMRVQHNTLISDKEQFGVQRVKKTHTSPVERHSQNDGHDNPTRMRNARTKRAHSAKHNGITVNGSIPCPN